MNYFPAVCCCNAALVRPGYITAGLLEPCTPPPEYMDVLRPPPLPGYSAVVVLAALLVVRAMALTMYSEKKHDNKKYIDLIVYIFG